jgi:hypothetical protein
MLPLPVASGHSVNQSGGSVILRRTPALYLTHTKKYRVCGGAVVIGDQRTAVDLGSSHPLAVRTLKRGIAMAIYQCFFFSEGRIRNWENVECKTNSSLRTLIARRLVNVRGMQPKDGCKTSWFAESGEGSRNFHAD